MISTKTWAYVSVSLCEKRSAGTREGCLGRVEPLYAVSIAPTDFGSPTLSKDIHLPLSLKDNSPSSPVHRLRANSPAGRGIRGPQAAALLFLNGAKLNTGFSFVNGVFPRTSYARSVPSTGRTELSTTEPTALDISGVGHEISCARPLCNRDHQLSGVVR